MTFRPVRTDRRVPHAMLAVREAARLALARRHKPHREKPAIASERRSAGGHAARL